MKTKTLGVNLLLTAVLIALLALKVEAAETPALDQLVSNVMQASTATKSYQATVTQTILKESATTSPKVEGTGLYADLNPGTSSFMVVHEPGKELSTKELNQQEQTPATESSPEAQNDLSKSDPSGTKVRVTVDIKKFLQALQGASQVVVEPAVLDGRQIFKISADYDNGTKCVLSVDAQNWYVSEIMIDLFGTTFSQIIFTHRYFDGFWLPSGIVLYLPADGSEVIQQLDYNLAGK